ncbi:MAG: zinc ribbon domain-containing protein [Clostridia bacterium]|nr:zinc ribbon domain-containing protein [Clostridia bacterium]
MNCKNCGASLTEGAKFCTGCGKLVEEAPAFCASCGKALEAGVRFCRNCGAPVEKNAGNANASAQPAFAQGSASTFGAQAAQPSAAPAERFTALVRKTLSGVPFLVLSILISCMTLFSMISVFRSFDENFFVMLTQLLPLAFLIVSTVGCWLTWAGAKNPSDTGFVQKLKIAKIYANYQLVMTWIATIAIGVIGLLTVILSAVAVDAAGDLIDSVGELGLEEIGDVLRDVGGTVVALLFFVIAIIVGVMVLMIIRYTKLVRMVKAVVNGYETGIVPRISPMFYIVLTFIMAFFSIIGAFISFQIDAFSGLSSLVSVGVTVLPAVIFLMVKGELEACLAQPAVNAPLQDQQFVQK